MSKRVTRVLQAQARRYGGRGLGGSEVADRTEDKVSKNWLSVTDPGSGGFSFASGRVWGD